MATVWLHLTAQNISKKSLRCFYNYSMANWNCPGNPIYSVWTTILTTWQIHINYIVLYSFVILGGVPYLKWSKTWASTWAITATAPPLGTMSPGREVHRLGKSPHHHRPHRPHVQVMWLPTNAAGHCPETKNLKLLERHMRSTIAACLGDSKTAHTETQDPTVPARARALH